MRLGVQLLLINLVSLVLLLAALLLGYWKMLLTLHQTWLLTGLALGGGVLSSILFALLTIPLTNTINRLVGFSDSVARLRFDTDVDTTRGPEEVRRLAQSLQTMSRRLSESFTELEGVERRRRELVANISHDLRTPLASVQSYVEALQDGVVHEQNDVEKYLRTIHNETRRLSRLIDDLFELSKLEAGQQSLDPLPTHLDKVVTDALESHLLLLQEKSIRVEVCMVDDIPVIHLSPEKIHRVLSNLLQNAIRYAPVGSQIDVAVTRESAATVKVSIADRGPGVNPGEEMRLFERFYRADASRTRNTGGAGLGLAIARGLIELHGGEIGVTTRPDGMSGAVFWFTLQIQQTTVEAPLPM